jgi:LysM repeat protein
MTARTSVATVVCVALLAGCQLPRKEVAPAPQPEPARVAAEPEAPKPAQVPEGPSPGTPTAKAQAQQLFRQSAEALNEGNEEAARRDIAEGQRLDPDSKYGQCLSRGVSVDPEKTLGKAFTRYTVRPNETLGKIAQRALGDGCEFYLLARYNGIKVPRQLAGGQVIRIPGKTPLAPPPEQAKADAPQTNAPVPEPPPAADAAAQKAGLTPQALKAQIDRHHRDAQAAFRRQDLATAIREWDAVLALDPANDLARARKQEAIELDRRIRQVK